jgi:hypothetical protein
MQRISADFEVRDGYLWALRPGKSPLRVSTAMRPVTVYSDYRGLQFALGIEARPADRPPFRFRIDARELFVRNPVALEQVASWNSVECFRPDYLMLYLQKQVPGDDPVVATDLHFRDDDEPANRWFRRAWEESRKRALAVV